MAATAPARAPAPNTDAFEADVYEACSRASSTIGQIRREAGDATRPIQALLVDLGLVVSDAQAAVAKLGPSLLMGGAMLFGGTKLMIGLNRGKPVGYLLLLLILTALLWLPMLFRPRQTRRGSEFAWRMQQKHRALFYAAQTKRSLPFCHGL